MLDTRTYSNRMRRLLRAAIPVTPPAIPFSSGRRLSLLPAAALIALATFAVHAPAEAQTPAAPFVTGGERVLFVGWLVSGDTFELEYKETSAPDRASLTGGDPALGWAGWMLGGSGAADLCWTSRRKTRS